MSPKNLDRKLPVSTNMLLQYESSTKFKVPEGARVREARVCGVEVQRDGLESCANFMCDITLHCWRFTSFSSLLEESRGVAQRRGQSRGRVHACMYVHACLYAYRQASRQARQIDRQTERERERETISSRKTTSDKCRSTLQSPVSLACKTTSG